MLAGVPTSADLKGLSRPPREVIRRRGLAVPVRCALFWLLPPAWVGVYLVCAFVITSSVALCGEARNATVTNQQYVHSAKHGDSYRIEYVYKDELGRHTHFGSVDASAHDLYPRGATISIRSIRMFDLSFSELASGSKFGSVPRLGSGVIFWNGIMLVIFYWTCLSPLSQRRLLREGEAAVGRITGKTVDRGRPTKYLLAYIYTGPDGAAQTQKIFVRQVDYDLANVGDEALVFYNPRRPGRSTLYKYCEYSLRDARGQLPDRLCVQQ